MISLPIDSDSRQRVLDRFHNTSWTVKAVSAGLILSSLLFVAHIFQPFNSHNTLKGKLLQADDDWVDATQDYWPCPTDGYISTNNDVVRPDNTKDAHIPVLNLEQITWISSIVHASAHGRAGKANNFLVHGLGFDSLIWRTANCLSSNTKSRTLFTENWQDWIRDVKASLPFVDVHYLTYNTTVAEYKQDLADRQRMDPMPPALAERCWDVTLIDAPQGYSDDLPGRVAPSFWALEQAARCLGSGARDLVYIFLHDIERETEGAIAKTLFASRGQTMGVYRQPQGDLTGWVLTRETLAQDPFY